MQALFICRGRHADNLGLVFHVFHDGFTLLAHDPTFDPDANEIPF